MDEIVGVLLIAVDGYGEVGLTIGVINYPVNGFITVREVFSDLDRNRKQEVILVEHYGAFKLTVLKRALNVDI